MDPERQRIEEDLRGLLAGDVHGDDAHAEIYSTDASIYGIKPLAVVRPRVTADVVATVNYATKNELPIHARGAGSGLAGGSLGAGIVVDFSRYMRRILSIEGDTAHVQAGVVHADLNRRLAAYHAATGGRTFGPDPAMSEVTTLGGVINVDGSGSHWPWYGSARDQVRELRAVLADGEVVELGRHSLDPKSLASETPAVRRLVQGVAELASRRRTEIEAPTAKSLVNASGYALHRVIERTSEGEFVNLAKLLVGSEGTLALVTEITVATQPLPKHRGCLLIVFDSLDKAAQAAIGLQETNPAACDLMDRRHLNLARETDVRYELLIPGAAEAALLIEHFADERPTLDGKLRKSVEIVRDDLGLAAGCYIAEDADDAELLWRLARRFVPMLHTLKGARRAIPCIEDIAVPPAALPVFLHHLQDVLKRCEVTASLFGHAMHGQLHIRPLLDLSNSDDVRRMELLASDLYEKVWLLGGTISGEHGDGLSRTPFLSRQHGPLMNVFRELKRLFDPEGVLNPGKIIPAPGARMTQNLRGVYENHRVEALQAALSSSTKVAATEKERPAPREVTTLQLSWEPGEYAKAAEACNGCGACRSHAGDTRMCPIFRFTPREEASPRSKANLVRAMLGGGIESDETTQAIVKSIADLCVHCHMCRLDCPASVDIPKLMLEAKGAHVKTNGMTTHDWWLSRIDKVSRWASSFPRLANWLLSHRSSRWLLEKSLGLAQGRQLPSIETRPFLRRTSTKRLAKPTRPHPDKVLYFVDTFANYYDASLADSFVRILQHNQIGVKVPADQGHSAMAMITQGALDPARQIASRNVEMLAEAVRQGFTIVATEPSAVLALTHEYPLLLANDEDAQLVADNTEEACHYLWQLHRRGMLRLDFKPLAYRVAYHVPCHVRALQKGEPGGNLLRLIPELRLSQLEKGCSGMAGMYGMQKKNYRSSLRAGLPLLTELRTGNYDLSVSECSTCQIQMRQNSPAPTVHPLKLLALSYDLAPAIAEEIKSAT